MHGHGHVLLCICVATLGHQPSRDVVHLDRPSNLAHTGSDLDDGFYDSIFAAFLPCHLMPSPQTSSTMCGQASFHTYGYFPLNNPVHMSIGPGPKRQVLDTAWCKVPRSPFLLPRLSILHLPQLPQLKTSAHTPSTWQLHQLFALFGWLLELFSSSVE